MRIKNYIFAVIVLFLSYTNLVAQNFVPFTPRFDRDLRGDMLVIGNNILNRDTSTTNPNDPYNGSGQNGGFTMNYIDIDTDATTFSSSSAVLTIPDPTGNSCYRIAHAGLYWSGMIQGSDSRTNLNQVKLKLPGSATYTNITGSILYDANLTPINNGKPYACYFDITTLVSALANPNGTYTLANVLSSTGTNPDASRLGLSAGWSIFIVYEDPTLTAKSIVSFDGFSGIDGATGLNFPVSGFRTIPVGPVRAKFAFTALEGDQDITGDFLRINGTTISTPQRPANNFFNSSITTTAGFFTTRTPNGSNTLGYDAGVLNINNPLNAVITNGATTATISLGTTQDVYYYFFNAFNVEIIEPEIVLTKVVKDLSGALIGGADVNLCQDLFYEISFQNIGNDDAVNFTIRDILPINVTFNPAGLTLPPGVTYTYVAATRTITFTIPNNLVNIGDPIQTIRIPVRVVCTCTELDDACSNVVTNQAFASYQGAINATPITDDPSLSGFSVCNLSPPSPTNFLVGLDDCNFTTNVTMCAGNPVTLTAANGYTSYVWTGPAPSTAVISNSQSVTVTTPGTYTVNDIISLTPCKSIVQTFIVTDFTAGLTNPVIPYADQVVICPNDGVELPLIFLCGATDSQLIQTNISGATSIVWEQLNTASCAAVVNPNCANINPACTWTNVGSGPNYNATSAGQFRIIINFPNGCSRTFYFNVFQNLLNPIPVPRDAVCTTPGQITITGVPAGYEYQLNCTGPWVPGNIFTGLAAGTYSVCIRQIGITGGCVFTLSNIPIRNRNFTVSSIITQPLCFGEKGTINLAANDVLPQYTFTIFQQPGNILVSSVGPTNSSNNVFTNLNPGTYSYTVTTQDGCTFSAPFTINNPPLLTVTAAITKPLACTDGEITVYPVGGVPFPGVPPSYIYVVTGAVTVTQSSPIISAPVAGTYNIQVVDSNNCTANTSITIAVSPPPVFTVNHTNIVCASAGNTGSITIDTTTIPNTPNGNTLGYSITGGAPFSNSNVFTNLAAGTYSVVVQYTLGTSVCTTAPQSVTITAPPAIVGTAALTTDYTCTHPGIITVSGVSGGTPGYTYSINGGGTYQVGTTFTITAAGTYIITIKDSAGCTFATLPIVVPPLNPPTDLSFNIIRTLSCPSNTVDINVNAVGIGGVAPLRYTLITPLPIQGPNASGQFNNLAPGTYCFEVADRNDCTYQECFTINPLPPFTVVGQVNANVRCFVTATGSGTFTVSGFLPSTYDYTITGPINSSGNNQSSPTINLTNLPAGTYTIVVTNDATNCTATTAFTIAGPTAVLAATITPSPITCLANGQVVINATGGWGGNVYTISPNPVGVTQAGNMFSNIPAGTYTVTTTDSGGCAVTNTFTLVGATPPTATISAASDFCYDSVNGATIVVTAVGGTPGYTYSINGQPSQVSNTFPNLTPATYTIIVTDSFGCTAPALVQTINAQLTLSTVLTKDLDCTASPNAVITGTIAGGYPIYTCLVNVNGSGFITNVPVVGSTFTYSTATSGTHQFQVTDTRGCVVLSTVIINPLVLPVITSVTQTTPILCNGDSTGGINIVVTSALPYTINVLQTTAPFTNYGTQTTGLPAGTYLITITDTKSCTDTDTIVIGQPAIIAYTTTINPITCGGVTGNILGSICINAPTGGTPPYFYTLIDQNTGLSTTFGPLASAVQCFPNINFGLYTTEVTDANNCTIVKPNLVMSSPPSDLAFVITPTIPSCAAGATVTVTVVPIVAGTNYVFGIVNTGPPLYSTAFVAPSNPPFTHVFTGLTPGVIYTFVVRDLDTGCLYFETMTAPTPTNSTLVPVLTPRNVTCRGAANGTISATLTGHGAGATSINYVVNNATTGLPVISGTIAGPPLFNLVNAGPLPPGNYVVYFSEVGGANAGCGVTSAPFVISESSTPLTLTASVIKNDNCNLNAGQIVAAASGGTAPYLYQILPSASPVPSTILPGAWLATNNVLNAESGNYVAYALDANGCRVQTPIIILPLDPSPVIAATLVNACVAQGTYQINVTMPTVGMAPYTFSIDGGAYTANTTPFTISGLSSGVHPIGVRDANGCGNTVSVTILTPLVVSAAFTIQPTCFNANGTITASASGGSALANYTYTLLTSASVVLAGPQASPVFPARPAGCYIIRVTDSATGCSANTPFCLDLPTPVSFTAIPTPVTCSGGNNGTITVNLTAGNNNPVYTYQITAGPSTTGIQTSNIFTGLVAGIYTVQVTSGRGCVLIDNNVIVGTPTPVVASGSATAFTCATDNSVNVSVLTVNGAGGTPAYSYSIDGINYFLTNTFNIINTGLVQNITVSVKDLNGCIDTAIVTINPLPVITATTVTQTTAITCTNPERVTITATGGSGTFTYQVLPTGAPNVVQVGLNQFEISAPGTYFFQVNDVVTGCYRATLAYTVLPFNTIDVVATPTTPITCFGNTNGAITINVTGYTGAYSYTVLGSVPLISGVGNTAANPLLISGLGAGNYTVQVTETASPFCIKVSNSVTVAGPTEALALTALETANVTCTNNQGVITATATGGWGTYVYSIAPPLGVQTGNVFSSLPAGPYMITVRDLLTCTTTANVTLVLPAAIAATVNATTPLLACFGDTTSINISNVTGGQGGNYSYTIKGPLPSTIASGPQPLPASGSVSIPGIAIGSYDIEITDGWNCASNFPVNITQPPLVNANLTQASILTCTPGSASVTLTGSGGTPPYRYSANIAGPFNGPFNPSVTITGLNAGTYNYYIQDANGCISALSGDVPIVPLDPLTLTLLSTTDTTLNCVGDNDGTINVVGQGGLGNYVYTLTNTGTGVVTTNLTGSFTGLSAGNYQVDVVSGDCDTPFIPITITQPTTAFDISLFSLSGVSCSGDRDGEIVIRITGYVGPLTYVITTSTAIPPVYNQQTIELPVTQTPPVTIPPTPFDPLVWYATIPNLLPSTVSSAPGVTPITYSDWYSILVQNGPLGCSDDLTNLVIQRPEPLASDILPSATQHIQCFGDTNGSFTVVGLDLSGNPIVNLPVSGGTPVYQITLNYVTHYDTSNPPVLIDDSVYINLNNGIGGLVPNTHIFSGLAAGTYHGAIKDANGCVKEFTQIINDGPNFAPYPEVTYECVNNAPANQVIIHANSTPAGQLATFSLDGGAYSTPATTITYTNLTAGTHSVDIRINNCTHTISPITINAVAPLAFVSLDEVFLNQLIATVSGGVTPYNYDFMDETGSTVQNGSNNIYIYDHSAEYTVEVTDSNGCFVRQSKNVTFIPIVIPPAYTPGDGSGWSPQNTSNYPNLITYIYDRYGRKVAELPEGQQWYGKYNGQELPSGDYWYVVKVDASNAEEFVGHFTLYR